MNDILDVTCEISIDCAVNPTENVQKIQQSLTNVFPELVFEQKNSVMYAHSADLRSLLRIFEDIRNKQSQKSFRKQFRKNIGDDSLWFYLNKQAAFANIIALCERDDESPLGPIKVSITSDQIDDIAEWLIQM